MSDCFQGYETMRPREKAPSVKIGAIARGVKCDDWCDD